MIENKQEPSYLFGVLSEPKGGGCLVDNTCKGEEYDQCTKGFTGPLCAHCEHNYVYANGSCKSCENLSHVSRLSVVTLLIFILAMGLIIVVKKNNIYKKYIKRDIKLYIEVLIIYFQLLGLLKKLKIEIHPQASFLLDVFSVINFDNNSSSGS